MYSFEIVFLNKDFPSIFDTFWWCVFEIVFFVVYILWGGFPCLSSSWKALISFWMGVFIISEHLATLPASHLGITPWQLLLYVQSFIPPCGLSECVCFLVCVSLPHTKDPSSFPPSPTSLLSSPRQSQGSIRFEFPGAFLSAKSLVWKTFRLPKPFLKKWVWDNLVSLCVALFTALWSPPFLDLARVSRPLRWLEQRF